jgi:hypothetical protein
MVVLAQGGRGALLPCGGSRGPCGHDHQCTTQQFGMRRFCSRPPAVIALVSRQERPASERAVNGSSCGSAAAVDDSSALYVSMGQSSSARLASRPLTTSESLSRTARGPS